MLKDGRAVAVKRLYERSLKHVEQFKNEVEILKSLKHPNLVILYGCTSRHSKELLLVYEYISNGTLADHLHGDHAESRPLSWSVRLNVAIETASGLTFLHASGKYKHNKLERQVRLNQRMIQFCFRDHTQGCENNKHSPGREPHGESS